jgi:adhesin HecA-like repeat protein
MSVCELRFAFKTRSPSAVEKTQGGLIYAKNQLQITAANHLLNDKSSIVAEGDIVINDTNHGTNNVNKTYEPLYKQLGIKMNRSSIVQ